MLGRVSAEATVHHSSNRFKATTLTLRRIVIHRFMARLSNGAFLLASTLFVISVGLVFWAVSIDNVGYQIILGFIVLGTYIVSFGCAMYGFLIKAAGVQAEEYMNKLLSAYDSPPCKVEPVKGEVISTARMETDLERGAPDGTSSNSTEISDTEQ